MPHSSNGDFLPSETVQAPTPDLIDGTRSKQAQPTDSCVLHRDLHKQPEQVVSATGLYLNLPDGRRVIDATGGAAVSCIGHGDWRVGNVMASQVTTLDYCTSMFFSCPSSEALARLLVDSTDGKMAKALIVNSGEFFSLSNVRTLKR